MNRAFSLVELSIVLVILGLLTGGILAGQSLIRAAELRSISNDTQRYITAVYAFRDKYFAIPGDMANAVKFWGAQAGGSNDGVDAACGPALTTAATGTATCNGNGNGNVAAVNAENYESYRSWQQLANAGLIEGSYSGVTAGSANTFSPSIGVNSPRGRLSGTGFTFVYYAPTTSAADPTYFVGPNGNMFWFGGASASYTSSPVLKPEEAWNVDVKLDDGKPGFGNILSTKSATTCNTNTNPAVSEYQLSLTGLNCQLFIRTRT